VKRREFITALGVAAVWPLAARGQQAARVYRVGTLTPARPLSATSPDAMMLLGALAERGYALGRNLAYDARASGGDNSKLPELLQDFKASGVDVIVTLGYPATLAAKTAGIPTVVASGAGDPVATGLVESLARPGGTVTGISDDATALSTKRLSLLGGLLPKLQRVAMLWNADDLGMSLRYEASAAAARSAGVVV
jgi:putative tryptophan/tyrosine transport system substrate-binding protein